jgi:hypothetical protein
MAEAGMPKNIAQWTGFAVTVIIVLGRDADVLTAVPLGIAAGMLAALFQQAMRTQLRPFRLAVAAVDLQRPLAALTHVSAHFRPKRRHREFQE